MIRQGSRAARKRRDDLPAQKSHNSARLLERLSNFSLVFAAAFFLRLIYLWQIDAIPLFYNLAGDGRTYDEWAHGSRRVIGWGRGFLSDSVISILSRRPANCFWPQSLAHPISANYSWCRFMWADLLRRRTAVFSHCRCCRGVDFDVLSPAIFYDGLIEKSILDLTLFSLALFVLLVVADNRWAKWLACGGLLGLLGLSRENALILVPVVAAWIILIFASARSSCGRVGSA